MTKLRRKTSKRLPKSKNPIFRTTGGRTRIPISISSPTGSRGSRWMNSAKNFFMRNKAKIIAGLVGLGVAGLALKKRDFLKSKYNQQKARMATYLTSLGGFLKDKKQEMRQYILDRANEAEISDYLN